MASIGCTRLILPFLRVFRRWRHWHWRAVTGRLVGVVDVDNGRHAVRAIWKGAVSFGLVSIPVKLYTATEEKDVSFHQVHREDGGRIRYKRVCQVDGEEVAVRGHRQGLRAAVGETVVLTDDDFADLPLTSSRVVDVLSFVPLEQVDPIYFAQELLPGAGEDRDQAVRAAARRAGAGRLGRAGQGRDPDPGVAGHAAGARRRAGAGDDALAGRGARPPTSASWTRTSTVRPQELAMAESLIETHDRRLRPRASTTTTTARRCEKVIEAKIEGREVVEQPVQEEDTGSVVDLMAALRASVAAAKKGRGEADEQPRRPRRRRPRRHRPRRPPPRRRRRRRPPRRHRPRRPPAKKSA